MCSGRLYPANPACRSLYCCSIANYSCFLTKERERKQTSFAHSQEKGYAQSAGCGFTSGPTRRSRGVLMATGLAKRPVWVLRRQRPAQGPVCPRDPFIFKLRQSRRAARPSPSGSSANLSTGKSKEMCVKPPVRCCTAHWSRKTSHTTMAGNTNTSLTEGSWKLCRLRHPPCSPALIAQGYGHSSPVSDGRPYRTFYHHSTGSQHRSYYCRSALGASAAHLSAANISRPAVCFTIFPAHVVLGSISDKLGLD